MIDYFVEFLLKGKIRKHFQISVKKNNGELILLYFSLHGRKGKKYFYLKKKKKLIFILLKALKQKFKFTI